MGNVVEFAAVNTKVKALQGNFLNDEQYTRLLESKSYIDALKYLKEETSYKDALMNYNMEDIHRGKLEILLEKYYSDIFYKLSHYLSGEYKKLFNILFMKFEIEDIKVIIRGKLAGADNDYIRDMMAYKSHLSTINYESLITANNIEEVAERLKGTNYYDAIAPVVNTAKTEGFFRIEMYLDFVYFSSLRKYAKRLSKEDKEIVTKLNGTYCDLLNIQWILRGKKYYSLQPEELLNYTIYDGKKLNRETIKALCYSKDLNEFYEIIEKLPYKEVFLKTRGQEEYLLEKEILSYLKNLYNKIQRSNALDVSVVMSYVELLLLEVKDIIAIIENKRYNTQHSEAKKYITATL